MQKNSLLEKRIAFGIIVLFLSTCFLPLFTGTSNATNQQNISEVNEPSISQPDALVTCYAIGGVRSKPIQFTSISSDDAKELIIKLQSLEEEIQINHLSEKAQVLQQDILIFAEGHGLLPQGFSSKSYLSRLADVSKMRLPRILSLPLPIGSDSEFLCNFITTGSGAARPIIILPRLIPILLTPIPRAFVSWNTPDGVTSVGGLRSMTGFIAVGYQKGIALGFWGIGFSVFLPPISQYGLFGYAFYARVTAEQIEQWPPNNPPEITGVDPTDRDESVPLSTSELRFQIADADEDLMSYTVTTNPDIGLGSGGLKKDGVYAIPIQDLTYDRAYSWTVEVTDGKDTVAQTYRFSTEGRPPFDPFNEGWSYRKKITIDHTKVAASLNNFVVLISTLDPDLPGKTQTDGGDILFMTDVGVAPKLYHEIEYYDASTGRLVIWVKIPSLSSIGDTTVYMYYGNPSSPDLSFPEKVWDSSYVGVYHLSEGGTGTRYDSTSNGKDMTPQNYEGDEAISNGKIEGCDNFSGEDWPTPEYLKGSDSSTYWNSASGTLSAWIYIQKAAISDVESIFTKQLRRYGGWNLLITSDKKIYHEYYNNGWMSTVSNVINWTNGTWYYVVGTRGPLGNNLYLNGMEVSYSYHYTGMSQFSEYGNGYVNIGGDGSGEYDSTSHPGHPFGYTGMIDEARVSLTQKTPQWISTEYNNQNDPASFVNIGLEESKP